MESQQTGGRYCAVPRVLIFLTWGEALLLLRGGPAKWFAGRYNGIGGHVEPGESVLAAARRECYEESGLVVSEFDLAAVIHVQTDPPPGVMLFVLTAEAPAREVTGSTEGELVWVAREELAGLPLIEDLHWLLPRLWERGRNGAPLYAHYSFGPDGLSIQEG